MNYLNTAEKNNFSFSAKFSCIIVRPVSRALAGLFLLGIFLSVPSKLFAQNSFYWDSPKALIHENAQFPQVLSSAGTTFLFYEQVNSNSTVSINLAKKQNNVLEWQNPVSIAGPFNYSGDVPDMYSAAIAPNGTIAVAVLVSDRAVAVYVSHDGGVTFNRKELPRQIQQVVGPRLFASRNGSFILFTALGANETFSLLSSTSSNGDSWSTLTPFAPSISVMNPFAPALLKVADGDLVVFQGQYQYMKNGDSRRSYQLYATKSTDGLKTWSPVTIVTNERSIISSSAGTFENYNNQRAVLYSSGIKNYLAWERTYYTSEQSHIWVTELSDNGNISGGLIELTTSGDAHRPILFNYNNTVNAVWFDNRRGSNSVYMASNNGFIWDESMLVSMPSSSTFVYPVLTNALVTGADGTQKPAVQLSFVWQQELSKKKEAQLFVLYPDTTVVPPKVLASNFIQGKRSTAQKVKARVVLPEDSSGIAGFSWIWTTDPSEEPPEYLMNLPSELNLSASADTDGEHYFKVRATDYAGNWSKSSTIVYYRDLTPPLEPSIILPPLDKYGFVESNAFSVNWKHAESDDDVAGYSWAINRVSDIDKSITTSKRHPNQKDDSYILSQVESINSAKDRILDSYKKPPAYNQGSKTGVEYSNLRNGIYTFSVCAIDTVGNISKPQVSYFIVNKYEPFTYISGLQTKKDDFGDLEISVYGQDFNYDGIVKEIYIDRDGKAPYDKTLTLGRGDYRIVSNSLITGIKLSELELGNYGIFLNHTDRGIYPGSGNIRTNRFVVDETGTVKIEHQYEIKPEWTIIQKDKKVTLQTIDILMYVLMALAALGAFASFRGLALTAGQTIIIRKEVQALLTGDDMPLAKKQKAEFVRQKGVSLKIRLVGFTAILVLMIVLMVSIPLGLNMLKTQERTLASGLENRVNVLMESMSTGVRSYLPSGLDNIVELNYLPQQTNSLKEASYATILGMSADKNNTNLDYVWASNDEDILDKIDTPQWSYGRSRLTEDKRAEQITIKCHELESQAQQLVGYLTEQIRSLNAEGGRLARATDSASVARRNEINDQVRKLNAEVTSLLGQLSESNSGAEPFFDNDHLDKKNTEYLFFKPVIYRQGGDNNLVHAVVIMQISTVDLIKEVDSARNTILFTSVLIALLAIALGIAGSYILASFIVKPIKALVEHVNKIAEVKDKKLLKDYSISVKTHDEIGILGDAVNDMTAGLVKAAEEEEKAMEQEKMALDGKAVQQTFLPLMTSDKGAKMTTARLTEKNIQISGYYEGADAVSGDYFDYKKLDERYYAIIKCDVSGHGVPAALMMTVVATLFRKYFEDWTMQTKGTKLDSLVVQINDFIESLGVKGKFATLLICLFDTKTGDAWLCNAGDNLIHVFDSASRVENTITLHEAPAAGPLPSFMVEMKGGFKVEKIKLKPNDVLFLYTDGIEEATRFFRDSNYEITKCAEDGLSEGEIHENHKVGQESEQMEPERVKAILESVLNRQKFVLHKWHSPEPQEVLEFDFTGLEGSIDDAIIALAAVEKVFRMYKSPKASGSVARNDKGDVVITGDGIRVDRRIDEFLKATFSRYDYYCGQRIDMEEANYVYYTGLNEDPQADDLTLLALRKL